MNIYLESGKTFVWQWDERQRIVLVGYPADTYVHFSNCNTVEAPVVVPKMDGEKLVADIPPELMQEAHDITAYICTESVTQHCHFIPVLARPKPDSYVYEPVEILRYEMLDERVRALEAQPPSGVPGSGVSQETDPTVPQWAKQPNKPTYTAQEVGADPAGTASGAVADHNTAGDSHNDIRLELAQVMRRMDAALNSTDVDLDQLAEIVAYMKSNKSLIDAITTSKVSVSDIVNNLTTNLSDRALSAAQGVVLKSMIDQNRTHYTEMVEQIVTIELDGTGPVIDAELCAKLYARKDEAVFLIGGVEYGITGSVDAGETYWSGRLADADGKGGELIYCYASGDNGIDAIAIRNNGTGSYVPGTIKFPNQTEVVHRLDPKYLPEMTLGIHTDNLLHLFVDGKPVGDGVRMLGAAFVGPEYEVDENGDLVLDENGDPVVSHYERLAIDYLDALASYE